MAKRITKAILSEILDKSRDQMNEEEAFVAKYYEEVSKHQTVLMKDINSSLSEYMRNLQANTKSYAEEIERESHAELERIDSQYKAEIESINQEFKERLGGLNKKVEKYKDQLKSIKTKARSSNVLNNTLRIAHHPNRKRVNVSNEDITNVSMEFNEVLNKLDLSIPDDTSDNNTNYIDSQPRKGFGGGISKRRQKKQLSNIGNVESNIYKNIGWGSNVSYSHRKKDLTSNIDGLISNIPSQTYKMNFGDKPRDNRLFFPPHNYDINRGKSKKEYLSAVKNHRKQTHIIRAQNDFRPTRAEGNDYNYDSVNGAPFFPSRKYLRQKMDLPNYDNISSGWIAHRGGDVIRGANTTGIGEDLIQSPVTTPKKSTISKPNSDEVKSKVSITADVVNIKSKGVSDKNSNNESKGGDSITKEKGFTKELLGLTTKMVVSRVLFPKLDSDVRMLIVLIMRPVANLMKNTMTKLGRGIMNIGRSFILSRSINGNTDGNIFSNITGGIKNKYNSFKGIFKRDNTNSYTDGIRTNDGAHRDEDSAIGKVRRSYGIFFNYLSAKSNIFKASIGGLFDTLVTRSKGFLSMFSGLFGGNKSDQEGEKKGGIFEKIAGLITGIKVIFGKIVSVISAIAGALGLKKIFGGGEDIGDDYDRRGGRRRRGGRTRTSRGGITSRNRDRMTTRTRNTDIPKKGFLSRAWEGAKKIGGKVFKGLGKSTLKKIPVIGALAGLGFGIQRLLSGDVTGAGMEVMSGLASTVPVVGTGASVGLDLALMTKDAQTDRIDRKVDELRAKSGAIRGSGIGTSSIITTDDGKTIIKYDGNIEASDRTFVDDLFDKATRYNINKDANNGNTSNKPIIIDNSQSSIQSVGDGGFLNGAQEPLIVDARNSTLASVLFRSLSKGVV